MVEYAKIEYSKEEVRKLLNPSVREWFSNFKELTLPQKYGIKLIHDDRNVLISAPTGSGKTLTAFMSVINELVELAEAGNLEDRIYCIYISPLRALAADIEKNLNGPLNAIEQIYKDKSGKEHGIRVAMRSGDTTASERAKMVRKPPHILITTPESLAIILSSPKFIEFFKWVKWVIVDEIHELANGKRGVHLSLSLERLQNLNEKKFVRIGLSATIAPLEDISEFLAGYENGKPRDCIIVNAQYAKEMKLELIAPTEDLIYTTTDEMQKRTYKILDDLIQQHETTLIFTNTRSGTERLVHHLKEYFPKNYLDRIEAHHSSLSREERKEVENKLKRGELKVVVSSTSLELGIDIGSIDLVIQMGSPKSVSRALQRTGRSGHDIYKISESKLIGTDRDDLVEMGVMLQEAYRGHVDKVQIPQNCLDVLAQHVVGMAVEKQWQFKEALELIRQGYCYRNLDEKLFKSVLLFLSGSYASLEKYRVYGKIWYDEEKGEFGRRGKLLRVLYATNIGTIPDSVSITVYLLPLGRHIGNIEEDFLERLKKGDRFVLGGNVYMYEYAKGMNAYVSLASGQKPTIPQWFSEMLPLSFDLAIAINKFRGTMGDMLRNKSRTEVIDFIKKSCHCNEEAAIAIYNYFADQMAFLNILRSHVFHSEKQLVIEEFLSEGKRHFIFHTLFGRRVNDVLCKVLAARISHKINRNVVISFNDNGFVLTMSRAVNVEIKKELFLLANLNFEEEAREAIKQTETLKRKFRDVAVRSLMILRNYMGRRRSVGKQQMSAHIMLGISTRLPDFPVITETYREILEDHMDLKNAKTVQKWLKDGEMQVTVLPPYDLPSPFAQLLITQGISDVVLIADRKAILEQLHTLVLKRIGKVKE